MPASLSRPDPETRNSVINYNLAFRMTQVISDRDAGHVSGWGVAAVNLCNIGVPAFS